MVEFFFQFVANYRLIKRRGSMVDIFPKDFEKKSPSYKNSNSEQTPKIILPPPAKKIIDTLRPPQQRTYFFPWDDG